MIDDMMVEAIALSSPSGRMSKRARKAAMKRMANKLFPKQEKPLPIPESKPESVNALDNFEIGQQVIARFTNSHNIFEFKGKIIGKTKNYWKVESITSPYPGEQPGRVFQIAAFRSRTYSANNCVVRSEESNA